MAFLFAGYAARLVGWLGRNRTHEIPLTDDLLARLSVVDTVAARAASERDQVAEAVYTRSSTRPPITIAEGARTQLEVARPFMRRCPCHASDPELGRVWVWNGKEAVVGASPVENNGMMMSRQPAREDFTGIGDGSCRKMDEHYLCMPFICPDTYRAQMWYIEALNDSIVLPARHDAIFDHGGKLAHAQDCPWVLKTEMPTHTTDAFGTWANPIAVYKSELQTSSLACVWCNRRDLHGISPIAYRVPMLRDRESAMGRSVWRAAARTNLVWNELGRPEAVRITAWNSAYCPIEWLSVSGLPTIVLVHEVAAIELVKRKGGHPVLVKYLCGGPRTLGNMRLWVAAALPLGVVGLVANTYPRHAWLFDLSVPVVAPVEGMGASIRNVIAANCTVVGGTVRLAQFISLTRAGKMMHQYGLEESVLEHITTPVTRVDHLFSSFLVTLQYNPEFQRVTPLTLRSTRLGKFISATGTSRNHTLTLLSIVRSWTRADNRGAGWLAALALPVGKYQDAGPVDISEIPASRAEIQGLPTTVSGAIASEIGMLNWFVFGSHGDVVPVQAIARRLKGWGIPIRIVRVHTEHEGAAMLAAVEKGQVFSSAPLFVKLLAAASTAPGLVFAPPEVASAAMGVSLRPPTSIVHPTDFGMGAAFNFLLEAFFRGWAPIVNIGAYAGVHWLPRSADGETFLEQSRNSDRPVDIMVAWGSSSLPKPVIPGAVEVKPGDHYTQFTRAKVVVTHGGAGTVQTAAAAGARVVAATSVLDRKYRDPTNAGRSVVTGVDPDRAMLTLLPSTPKVWIWAWKHSWSMFLQAILWSVPWVFGPALWVAIALLVKSLVFVVRIPSVKLVFTMSFASTMIATVVAPSIGVWWAILLSPQAERLAVYIMEHAGVSYLSVFLSLVNVLASASRSPLTWALILSGHGTIALPVQFLLSSLQVGPMIATEMISLILGFAGQPRGENCALVGITWAWEGSNIPAFHTRFLSPDKSRVLEGEWVGGDRSMGALYSLRLSDNRRPNIHEWCFPTAIPWAHFEEAKPVIAPYSPLWNCQSAMLLVTRGTWSLLGVSLLVMAPMGIFMLLSMMGSLIFFGIVGLLIEVVPVVTLTMQAIGHGGNIPIMRAYLRHTMEVLVSNPNDWFTTAVSVMVGMGTGWGTSDWKDKDRTRDGPDGLLPSLLAAETVEELIACVRPGDTLGILEHRLFEVKMSILTKHAGF